MGDGPCTLGCWAKVVAWFQVVSYAAIVAVWIIGLTFGSVDDRRKDFVMSDIETKGNDTILVTVDTTEEEEPIPLFIAIILLMVVILYYILMFLLSFCLLNGVYKDELKFVKWWLIAKTGLLSMAAAWMVLNLFALLLGIDNDLTKLILSFVVDALMVWIIYCYWEEKKCEIIPA